MTPPQSFWISPSFAAATTKVDSICFGTGRFLRAVWVPALQAAHYHPVFLQPRGRSFVDSCLMQQEQSSSTTSTKENAIVSLPVDTVLASGDIQTDFYDCYGAFSWGTPQDQDEFYNTWWASASIDTTKPFLIAVGVTEAGLASADTEAMQQLYRLLLSFMDRSITTPICVVNTDNVPNNGCVIRTHMLTLLQKEDPGEQQQKRQLFLDQHVVFLNSMVDRITSHRPNDPLVPRAEPQPAKAFVVADVQGDLPQEFQNIPGIVIRSTMEQLNQDIAWKLRIANGTHTALAHALALCSFPQTDILSSNTAASSTFMTYLDTLVQNQILVPLPSDAVAVWEDWRQRLLHPHFGLSTFFITQNGAAKGGIRFSPTVCDLLRSQQQGVTVAMAWAFAVLLRWLTPAAVTYNPTSNSNDNRYRGWLSQFSREQIAAEYKRNTDQHSVTTEEYADQLAFDIQEGWYDFRCSCSIRLDGEQEYNLSDCLVSISSRNEDFHPIIRAYLVAEQGGKMQDVSHLPYFEVFVAAVSQLYAELVTKNNVLDSLEQLIRTKALDRDCQTLVSGKKETATNLN